MTSQDPGTQPIPQNSSSTGSLRTVVFTSVLSVIMTILVFLALGIIPKPWANPDRLSGEMRASTSDDEAFIAAMVEFYQLPKDTLLKDVLEGPRKRAAIHLNCPDGEDASWDQVLRQRVLTSETPSLRWDCFYPDQSFADSRHVYRLNSMLSSFIDKWEHQPGNTNEAIWDEDFRSAMIDFYKLPEDTPLEEILEGPRQRAAIKLQCPDGVDASWDQVLRQRVIVSELESGNMWYIFRPEEHFTKSSHIRRLDKMLSLHVDQWEHKPGNSNEEIMEAWALKEMGNAFGLSDPEPTWDDLLFAAKERAAKLLDMDDSTSTISWTEIFDAEDQTLREMLGRIDGVSVYELSRGSTKRHDNLVLERGVLYGSLFCPPSVEDMAKAKLRNKIAELRDSWAVGESN